MEVNLIYARYCLFGSHFFKTLSSNKIFKKRTKIILKANKKNRLFYTILEKVSGNFRIECDTAIPAEKTLGHNRFLLKFY